jgi:hypothetical protein
LILKFFAAGRKNFPTVHAPLDARPGVAAECRPRVAIAALDHKSDAAGSATIREGNAPGSEARSAPSAACPTPMLQAGMHNDIFASLARLSDDDSAAQLKSQASPRG